ncbi:MAG: DUF1553 domain-containing protein [Planctomycetota bacterium]|nr:MAG: DUF1553 domain-containing protein [Planctomycetota bacterium]
MTVKTRSLTTVFQPVSTHFRRGALCVIAGLVSLLNGFPRADDVAHGEDGVTASNEAVVAEGEKVDFIRDIRPILSNNCFQCHGPDSNTREADLRLDAKAGVFGGDDREPVIVPGEPEQSELLRRVSADDPDEQMPPADSEYQRLSPDQIDLIRRWIAQGAEWEEHWAFITPERPDFPDIANADWPINGIDYFVLARMGRHGFEPSEEADKETLIRRVTYDLTGLPPSLEEVDAFLADDSPDAYERLVDRLLDSPHYGEHMTRYWLDAVRYGDTHGLHLDNIRSLWPYRDWLINAFNTNRPFDQMTIEQIAGDLLPEATLEQRVATGFNRCNVTTSEGGSIPEEFYVRYTVDRVETMSTVYMGLTLGCAVCHDHKFDPVSQKELYGLFAFYNSFNENPMDGNALLPPPVIEVPTDEQVQQRSELQTRLAGVNEKIRTQLAAIEYTDPNAEATPESLEPEEFVWIDDELPAGAQAQQSGHPWEYVAAPEPVNTGEKAHKRTGDGLVQHFFTGANPPLRIGQGDVLFTYVYLDPENPPQEIMLQWNDGSWEHRAYWGENVIPWGQDGQASRALGGDLPPAGEWVRLEVEAAKVGLEPGAMVNGWAFTQHGGTVYWDTAGIVTRTPQAGQTFDSQRVWELAVGEAADLPQPVKDAIKVAPAERNDDQKRALREYFLENVHAETKQAFAELHAERSNIESELNAVNAAIPKSMITEELPEPKPAFVLNRGEYDNKGEPVERHLPSVLPPLPEGAPLNRLGLARWLVDPAHPLTARVTVNRWWQRYFGTGLVKTAEDFGIQGDPPSHPELLDWLAVEFQESGWNVKEFQKLIVMSATYRQSSKITPEKLAADPENRLLARGPRFRMEAEMIRDTALFVSGLLKPDIGGPSVKPFQPAGLWKAVGYSGSNTVSFSQDDGPKLYRRSMYTFWKRTSHPPSMAIFDAPSRESCTVRRERTNTPLQALALMNDKQFVEAARHFAQRILRQGGKTDQERLVFAYRSVSARHPDARQLEILQTVLDRQREDFAGNPAAASEFIDSATTLLEPDHLDRDRTDDPELAAWTMVANLLLNLDVTVTKE